MLCDFFYKPGAAKFPMTKKKSRTIVANGIVDHSDVVGAWPVDAAPITSSFWLNAWLQSIWQRQLQGEMRNIKIRDFIRLILKIWRYVFASLYASA